MKKKKLERQNKKMWEIPTKSEVEATTSLKDDAADYFILMVTEIVQTHKIPLHLKAFLYYFCSIVTFDDNPIGDLKAPKQNNLTIIKQLEEKMFDDPMFKAIIEEYVKRIIE